jgi:hypothetical protein
MTTASSRVPFPKRGNATSDHSSGPDMTTAIRPGPVHPQTGVMPPLTITIITAIRPGAVHPEAGVMPPLATTIITAIRPGPSHPQAG